MEGVQEARTSASPKQREKRKTQAHQDLDLTKHRIRCSIGQLSLHVLAIWPARERERKEARHLASLSDAREVHRLTLHAPSSS